MDFRDDAFRAEASRGHASLSRCSEHERDGLDARGDFRPRDADGRSTTTGSADSAVSTVAPALTGLSSRRGWVASGAPWSARSANLPGCSLAAGAAVAPSPRLEQRSFDAHPTVVGKHRERSAAPPAGFARRSATTGMPPLATSSAHAERDGEVAATE